MSRIHWRSIQIIATFTVAAVLPAHFAVANTTVRTAWQARYTSVSTSYSNLSSGCRLCHATSGGANWNAYGWNIRQQIQAGAPAAQAIINVELMNSDGVSLNNLDEILASAQPGWTAGANNTYYYPTSTTPDQMPAPLVAGVYDPPVPCPADITGDGAVNVSDLLAVINGWGACQACSKCAADITGDCTVNVSDLLAVINAWGACP